MKKIITIMLCGLMLCGCGAKTESTVAETNPSEETVEQIQTENDNFVEVESTPDSEQVASAETDEDDKTLFEQKIEQMLKDGEIEAKDKYDYEKSDKISDEKRALMDQEAKELIEITSRGIQVDESKKDDITYVATKAAMNQFHSRKAIINDLINAGFSEEDAKNAAEELKYDFNENALKRAKIMRYQYGENADILKMLLNNDSQGGFEKSEAKYALEHLYD